MKKQCCAISIGTSSRFDHPTFSSTVVIADYRAVLVVEISPHSRYVADVNLTREDAPHPVRPALLVSPRAS
jgi:hypothetical protein